MWQPLEEEAGGGVGGSSAYRKRRRRKKPPAPMMKMTEPFHLFLSGELSAASISEIRDLRPRPFKSDMRHLSDECSLVENMSEL